MIAPWLINTFSAMAVSVVINSPDGRCTLRRGAGDHQLIDDPELEHVTVVRPDPPMILVPLSVMETR
jgi:hypothetical protein